MATHPQLAKLAQLLARDEVEVQAAAAIVARELALKDRAVVEAVESLLASPVKAVQRAALEALAVIGGARQLPALLPFLSHGAQGAAGGGAGSAEELRRLALAAIERLGLTEAALPLIRGRLPAAPPWERRALEEALAQLGGRDSFAALLAGLAPGETEQARAAVHPLRARLHGAPESVRRPYRAEAERFLRSKSAAASPAGALAALRVLGYCADPASTPLLLAWARDARRPAPTREEALIALRLCLAPGDAGTERARTAAALVALAVQAPLPVARVALLALGGLPVGAAAVRRLGELATHPEGERGLLALDFLATRPDPEATAALAALLGRAPDRARAEAAARALAGRPEAPAALVQALLQATDGARAAMLAGLLRPRAKDLERSARRKLVTAAAAAIEEGGPEERRAPLLEIARVADPAGLLAALRTVCEKLRRGKDQDRALDALRVLVDSPGAAPDDAWALARQELLHGQRERGLELLARLSQRGFDVTRALFSERGLDDEARYAVGFHFAERQHDLGEEILGKLAENPRSKLGKMARAKLRSAGLAAS